MEKCGRMLILPLLLLIVFSAQADLSRQLSQKISANFQNTSLPDVLRILASQYNLNIVVGEGVAGRVTIQLTDVSLEDALKSILISHGCHYIVQNDIILVKSFEEQVNGELTSQVFRLKYLDGVELVPTLQPLLSEKGKIQPLISEKEKDEFKRRSDMIVVTDVWENVKDIASVIEEMDKMPVQLQIEVKLVETLIGDNKQVGFNWPKKITTTMTGGEVTAPITKATSSSEQQQRYLAGWYELPQVGENITWGVLTVDELKATLEFLAQDNNSRIVSNPRLTTLNNKKAIIDVGTTVPVPEVSRGIGGDLISYREKQVSMYMEVIPRLNEGNVITLTVHPRLEEIIGYTGPADLPQPITSRREVTTQVTVREGETVVIGGLIKESKNKNVEKIWLLGDIPLLGYFFRHTSMKSEKTDLLIFITPTILKHKE
ncbi:MAG: hypothetical protein Kow0042_14540 [Calditrichia bacterium]